MMYPEVLETLIGSLKQLPGIGRRGAERTALALLEWPPDQLADFGALIKALPESLAPCPECGAWAEAGKLCSVCGDSRRDPSLLCVVENMPQLFAVENGGSFRGRYHVLGGRISPLENETGETLRVESLLRRVRSGAVQEVILALSSDVEGRATTVYLADLLKEFPVRVSRPAQGLPAGANLSYADGATIAAALGGRTEVSHGR